MNGFGIYEKMYCQWKKRTEPGRGVMVWKDGSTSEGD